MKVLKKSYEVHIISDILKYLNICIFCIYVFVAPWKIYADEPVRPTISEVEVTGNKDISVMLIKKQLSTRKGDKFDRININKDIKRLYQLNYFTKIDVDIVEDGTNFKVVFVVQEKPKISKIRFSGNKKHTSKNLKKQIALIEDNLLNEKILASDVDKLREFYETKGYKQSDIKTVTNINEEDNTVEVIFEISEGKKIKIKKINIIGATQIKEKEILKIMKTKKKKWYNKGFYERARFKEDLDRLIVYYNQKGYIDSKVVSVEEEYVEDNARVIINVVVEEGTQYKVGKISVSGNKVYDQSELLEKNKLKSDEIYLPENLSHTHKSIRDVYFKNGYIDAKINPKTYSGEEREYMNVDFEITENDVAFVDKIKIIGNQKTKDIVIRRELNVDPGEKYDGVKLEIAQKRLENIGIFKNVDIYPDPTNKSPSRDLFVEVEEDKTGELGFGAGYSSVDRLIGFVEISQRNFDLFNFPYFTGDGQKLKFRSEFGSQKKEFSLDFTEPWLFDKRLAFGTRLFTSEREYRGSDYSEARDGVSFSLSKPILKFSRAQLRYSFETVEIKNVSDYASSYLKAQEGQRDIGKVGFRLTRDVRDNFYNATKGSNISLDFEVAGVGGEIDYYRSVFTSDLYFNPLFNNILVASLKIGGMEPYGGSDEVPIFERFFLGGAWSVRGFDYRDLGPHDEVEEPMGGTYMYYGTFEWVIPMVEQFRVALFYDYGNLFAEGGDVDFSEINSAFGMGLRILIDRRIPLRFDYAWPVSTDDYHDGEGGKFTFDIGQRF